MSKRILFVGAPGSGKSWLCNRIYTELAMRHINVEMVHEWVRHDINANGVIESIWEQYRTREKQLELEDNVPDSYEWVVVDSGSLTPYFYACLYGDYNNPRQRLVIQDMFKYLLDDIFLKRYDYVFYIPHHSTYAVNQSILNDGTRYQTSSDVSVLDEHMSLVFTKLFKASNIYEIGEDVPLEQRVDYVLKQLAIA